MIRFVVKRTLIALPTLFALVTLVFFALRWVPGGPFESEKALPPEVTARLEAEFHLNEPLTTQYFRYIRGVLHFDLGPSYQYLGSRTVSQIVADGLPTSALIGSLAFVFAFALGLLSGVMAAASHGRPIDRIICIISGLGISIPSFISAGALSLIFGVGLGWFPPALWEGPSSAVLPVAALALRPFALISRMVRASMLESLQSDYIRTAISKGVPRYKVLWVHALRNSIVPLVSLLGQIMAALIAGSFAVEIVFAIPGLGRHFVSAVLDRDYTVVMGVTLVYGVLVVVANIFVDLIIAKIDPRVTL